jgi:hypothetical protein
VLPLRTKARIHVSYSSCEFRRTGMALGDRCDDGVGPRCQESVDHAGECEQGSGVMKRKPDHILLADRGGSSGACAEKLAAGTRHRFSGSATRANCSTSTANCELNARPRPFPNMLATVSHPASSFDSCCRVTKRSQRGAVSFRNASRSRQHFSDTNI